MVEMGLCSRSPLEGIVRLGRHGVQDGTPGVVLEERTGLQLASLIARKGQADAVFDAVRAAWDLDLPATPRRVSDARLAFIWSGTQQWLVVAEGWPGSLDRALRERLGGIASVAAQSDGRVVVRLSGPYTRDMLSKGMAIDLHPRAFRAGHTALTAAARVGVQIWQVDDAPTYELSAFRSYASSLYCWIVSAAEEYGINIVVRD